MNNCPKCGNPLQAGTTSCPICGTNISTSTPAQGNNVKVNSVAAPTVSQNQSAVQTTPVEQSTTNVQVQPITQEPQVVQPQPEIAVQPTVESVQVQAPAASQGAEQAATASQTAVQATPVAQQPVAQVSQPVQQAPVQAPVQQVAVQAPVQQPIQPVQQPVAQSVQPEIKAITPTGSPTQIATVPNIQAATSPVQAPTMVQTQDSQKPKGKKKPILLVAVVLIIAVVGVGAYMTFGSKLTLKKGNNVVNNNNTALASSTIYSNGYKFNLEDGWLINEDGANVILTNSNETVVIKLDHSASNIEDISEEIISNYLNNFPNYKDSEVEKTQISSRDAYIVNTNINDLPVQIYFIGGGTDLTLGITIIYQNTDAKEKYEANVTNMIGTISYSDDSLKAISTINMYTEIFNLYRGAINSKNQQQENRPATDENTSNPETPSTEENLPTPEESEN